MHGDVGARRVLKELLHTEAGMRGANSYPLIYNYLLNLFIQSLISSFLDILKLSFYT